jgi:hypothetical protein
MREHIKSYEALDDHAINRIFTGQNNRYILRVLVAGEFAAYSFK